MGLRCLLGHDFTEPTTEREREERGGEVVITVREVKECTRCGETQAISETTEVTSMGGSRDTSDVETADESMADRLRDSTVGASPSSETEDETVDDGFDHPRGDPADVDPSVEDDAEILEDGPTDSVGGEPTDQPTGQPVREPAETTEAESTPPERGHGEWPDSETGDSTSADGQERAETPQEWPDPDARPSDTDGTTGQRRDAEDSAATEARTDIVSDAERSGIDDGAPTAPPEDEDVEFIDGDDSDSSGAWPDQEGEDEGFDAEVGDGQPDENVTVDGNLTPRVNPNADVDDDAEFIEASPDSSESPPRGSPTDESGSDTETTASDTLTSPPPERAKNGSSSGRTQVERSAPTHEVELTTTVGNRTTEYLCPECGKRERVGASSMRAGDICPECKRGYIEERELK